MLSDDIAGDSAMVGDGIDGIDALLSCRSLLAKSAIFIYRFKVK